MEKCQLAHCDKNALVTIISTISLEGFQGTSSLFRTSFCVFLLIFISFSFWRWGTLLGLLTLGQQRFSTTKSLPSYVPGAGNVRFSCWPLFTPETCPQIHPGWSQPVVGLVTNMSSTQRGPPGDPVGGGTGRQPALHRATAQALSLQASSYDKQRGAGTTAFYGRPPCTSSLSVNLRSWPRLFGAVPGNRRRWESDKQSSCFVKSTFVKD